MLRIYTFPRPVVVACTGHALAAGAILLLVSDVRIGTRGDFKIGLNEVAIRLTLPLFALELARDRLSKRHFSAAVTQARIFDPERCRRCRLSRCGRGARARDRTALARAAAWSRSPSRAFRETKTRERAATVKYIRETLAADTRRLPPE